MKIDDVTLTIFAWDDIPSTKYGGHTQEFKGQSHLGLVTIKTDDGVEGHAFLGSASRTAAHDASSFMKHLKPMVMGQNPLNRERLWCARSVRWMWHFGTLQGRSLVFRCIS